MCIRDRICTGLALLWVILFGKHLIHLHNTFFIFDSIDVYKRQTTIEKHVAGSKISGVAQDFKMPQVWKSSIDVYKRQGKYD